MPEEKKEPRRPLTESEIERIIDEAEMLASLPDNPDHTALVRSPERRERSRDCLRRLLRGEITHDQAVDEILADLGLNDR